MGMTEQRRIILGVIRNSDSHMTAEQIYDTARETLPKISFGTVYRNLGKLSEENLIRRIVMPCEPDRFDKTSDPHDHIECVRCGKLFDVDLGDGIKTLVREKTGLEVENYELVIRGVCPECRKAAKNHKTAPDISERASKPRGGAEQKKRGDICG